MILKTYKGEISKSGTPILPSRELEKSQKNSGF
ncbi:MAG: hypothetical protein CM15mP129_03710 [Chloroflexota bacterium]|nr:MAG: hypothetical protein CM15mP129_03710 [Chloroflexota bacterium]